VGTAASGCPAEQSSAGTFADPLTPQTSRHPERTQVSGGSRAYHVKAVARSWASCISANHKQTKGAPSFLVPVLKNGRRLK